MVIKAMLLLIVIAHYFYNLHKTKHCYELKYTNTWQFIKNQQVFIITPLPSTVITPFAIFLHFKNENRVQTLLIAHDALSDDDYRRLIVKLKTTLS